MKSSTKSRRDNVAEYRLSAKTISRGKGQSAIASAAYRSAERLMDDRTGLTSDYSRRGGVLHSEIVAPDNTPDWMHDRAQLWNSVEAVERRKDAQLAREIQLSLPHELTEDQRRDLVIGFVREQFVDQGMIADIAIHAPSAEGDARNHHAHIMLTMRELTGDGFGKKVREWNSTDRLTAWREQWARHQNRELERHGHPARVDHRSYEAQGIDREPTQHLGPMASDMERKGKASRIGDHNRKMADANHARAMDQIEAAQLAGHRARFETWAAEKKAELSAAQDLTRLDLSQKHDRQKADLEKRLKADYGQAKATIAAELKAIDRRLEATGIRKLFRDALRRTRSDKLDRDQLTKSLDDIRTRESESRQALERRQETDRRRLKSHQQEKRSLQDRGIDNARRRAEKEHAAKHSGKARESFKDVAPANDRDKPPAPSVEPSERLSLDDRKRISDAHINEGDRNKLEKPFKRATLDEIRAKGSRQASKKPRPDRSLAKGRDPT